MKMSQNDDAKPVPPAYTSCAGKIRACVWESQEANGIRDKILISRFFKKDDSWQRGRTFYADELAMVVEAVSKAQQWIQGRHRQLEFADHRGQAGT